MAGNTLPLQWWMPAGKAALSNQAQATPHTLPAVPSAAGIGSPATPGTPFGTPSLRASDPTSNKDPYFSVNELTDMVQKIGQKINEIATDNQTLISNVNWLAAYIPGVGSWVQETTLLLNRLMSDFAGSLEASSVPKDAYRIGAVPWEEVITVGTDIPGHLDWVAVHADQHWKGSGLKVYEKIIPRQQEAAKRIGTSAKIISDALKRTAGYGLHYYVSLVGVVLKVASAAKDMAVAVVSYSPSTAYDALLKFADAIKDAFNNYFTLYQSLMIWCRPGIEGDLGDHAAWPDDNWPPSYMDALILPP